MLLLWNGEGISFLWYLLGQNAPLTRISVEYFAPLELREGNCLGRVFPRVLSCCFASKFLECDTREEMERVLFRFSLPFSTNVKKS